MNQSLETSESSKGLAGAIRGVLSDWRLVLILIFICAIGWRSVNYLLPSVQDLLDESYQPFQTLKFIRYHGTQTLRYGALVNMVLAPGFLTMLAYWRARGTLSHPSDKFPYGLSHPFEQMGAMHFEARLTVLILSIALLAYFGRQLQLITREKSISALALLLCVASSYVILHSLPNAKPDGLMCAFAAAALGVYLRIIYLGITPKRAFWLSTLAVCAISCKDLAGPTFVLPYLGLFVAGWRESAGAPARRRTFWKSVAVALFTGIIAYAILNVVYAPHAWVQRMRSTTGDATDPGIWGGATHLILLKQLCAGLLNNLGPGGTPICILAVAAILVVRPARWLLLLLPFLSAFFLGAVPLGYVENRFLITAGMALALPMAMGLQILLRSASRLRPVITTGVVAAVVANLMFATFAVHMLDAAEVLMEWHALAYVGKDQPIFCLDDSSLAPRIAGAQRFEWLGFRQDTRSLQGMITSDPAQLPQWIYADEGMILYINGCREYPKRAAALKKWDDFDFAEWQRRGGIEGLGYKKVAVLSPQTPAWFVFNWMPVVEEWRLLDQVSVYRRSP